MSLLNASLLAATFLVQRHVAGASSQRPPSSTKPARVGLNLLTHALLSAASLGFIAWLYAWFLWLAPLLPPILLAKLYLVNLVAGFHGTLHSTIQWQLQPLARETL